MPSPTEEFGIWKHSHGTTKTTQWSDVEREEFKADAVLKIFANTRRGQVQNFEDMRIGDFFFLCHGNNIQLLGRVGTEILNPRGDPLKRKYTVVRRLGGGPWKFTLHRKGWSPGGNTTCWPVLPAERSAFQKDILKPFFGMTLKDLTRWVKQTRGQLEIESEELVPPAGTPRPYKRSRIRPESRNSGPSSRVYDPDKTGHRAHLHDKCLDRLARMFRRGRMCDLKEKDYDLVVVEENKALLVEAKTIRGDADHQLRLALGQLLYYQHLFVERQFPRCQVIRLALTDQVPPSYLVDLLERYQVGVVSIPGKQKFLGSKLGNQFLKMFGVALKSRSAVNRTQSLWQLNRATLQVPLAASS